MASAHAVGPLIEALSRGLPGDRLVVDPDVLAATRSTHLRSSTPGRASSGSAWQCQALDDGEADGQLVFTAARRFCAAVVTPPRAVTTPDTVLVPGLAARLPIAVLSLASAELSALV